MPATAGAGQARRPDSLQGSPRGGHEAGGLVLVPRQFLIFGSENSRCSYYRIGGHAKTRRGIRASGALFRPIPLRVDPAVTLDSRLRRNDGWAPTRDAPTPRRGARGSTGSPRTEPSHGRRRPRPPRFRATAHREIPRLRCAPLGMTARPPSCLRRNDEAPRLAYSTLPPALSPCRERGLSPRRWRGRRRGRLPGDRRTPWGPGRL